MSQSDEEALKTGLQVGGGLGMAKGAMFGFAIGGPPGAILFGALGAVKGAFFGSIAAAARNMD